MYVENFYIGSTEYVINYKKGTHVVTEIDHSDYELSQEIFTGHYDACKDFLLRKNASYEESIL